MPSIMPWYAAALALIFVGLSIRVIRGRGLHRVNLGSGGVDDMERRIRAHGNFAEHHAAFRVGGMGATLTALGLAAAVVPLTAAL